MRQAMPPMRKQRPLLKDKMDEVGIGRWTDGILEPGKGVS